MLLSLSNSKKEKDRVSQFADIIAAMSVSKDIKELLELALNRTLQALSSDRGSIFLAGDDGKELFLRWAYNINSEEKDIRKKVGEGIVGKVAKDMEPVLVKDIRYDPRFSCPRIYNNYKENSPAKLRHSRNKRQYAAKPQKYCKEVCQILQKIMEKMLSCNPFKYIRANDCKPVNGLFVYKPCFQRIKLG